MTSAVGDAPVKPSKPKLKRVLASSVDRGELYLYDGYVPDQDRIADRLANLNTWAMSVKWCNLPKCRLHRRCRRENGLDRCIRRVPIYYRRDFELFSKTGEFIGIFPYCWDCIEWQRIVARVRWWKALKKGWDDQKARMVSVARRLGITHEEAQQFMDRADILDIFTTEKWDSPDCIQATIEARPIYANPEPDERLPGDDMATMQAEMDLHVLTGWVNDGRTTTNEVMARLALNRTLLALTGTTAPELSAARLRGRIWAVRGRCDAEDVPKSIYERADYDL